MARITKNQKKNIKKYNFKISYELEEAIKIIKDITYTKFNSSIDIAIKLGINTKKTDQVVKNNIVLPHGVGKKKKILTLCTKEKEGEAKDAGSDYVGLTEYIEKIKNGWLDFDIIIAMPSVMLELGKLGKILGPKGLMPNSKNGNITTKLEDSIKKIKKGKIFFKTDKYGIIHSSVGRISFSDKEIKKNIIELINLIIKIRPASLKGIYLKNITLSSTMSKSITIDKKNIIV